MKKFTTLLMLLLMTFVGGGKLCVGTKFAA